MPQMRLTLPVDPRFRTVQLDPFENLPVSVDHTTEILPEAVLVKNAVIAVLYGAVPEATGVGADLIGQHQFTLAGETEFDLEVDQLQVAPREQCQQVLVDLAGQLLQMTNVPLGLTATSLLVFGGGAFVCTRLFNVEAAALLTDVERASACKPEGAKP